MDPNLESRRYLRREKRLVRRAQRGDREAFAELYRTFAGPLYERILLPRLGDRAAAEDALADTFRTALEKLPAYEPRDRSVWHWLARMAANRATDVFRARARTGQALGNYERLVAPLLPASPRPGEALDARRDRAQLQARLADALAQLNPRYRRAIELRFLEGRTRQACAEALEVKVATFDVVLLRSLRSLRKSWQELTDGEERG